MRILLVLLVALPVLAAQRKPAMAPANPTREALGCVSEKEGSYLVHKKDGAKLILLQDIPTCEMIVQNAQDGVYCRYHREKTTLGKNARKFEGWFPTYLSTHKGIGPCPLPDLKVCLDVVANSRDGNVCTNTCTGWAVTHVETEVTCGASVTLDWCLKSSVGTIKNWICSYTGDGNGNLDNWVQTRNNPRCAYEGSPQTLESCRTSLLKKR